MTETGDAISDERCGFFTRAVTVLVIR